MHCLKLESTKTKCGIVNLDDKSGIGTHWVAYHKQNPIVSYFDSFGNLHPPKDLVKYLNAKTIKCNYNKYQNFDTFVCGHLCLKFLCNILDQPNNFILRINICLINNIR